MQLCVFNEEGASDWTLHTVNLSAYAGTTIRVVFHHQDYDNYFINIDNLGIECETPTTFNVTVPEGTDACYLVGTLNGWNIDEPIEMTKLDDTHYIYTAESNLTDTEYKYVHGADWAKVEKAADGSEMSNRVVNAEVMNDTVEKWADDDTALPNVNAKANANKFLHNGNIIIERNGIRYTTTGQKVR